MTADTILVGWGPGETRLALLAGDRAVELAVARASLVVGAVFLGRVVEVSAALDAAFVDIGAERPGFLPGAAGRSQGQALAVRVKADARAAKGALLTTEISLTGQFLAYAPSRPGLSASHRLETAEAERLSALLAGLAAPGEGLALRAGAAGRTEAELVAELATLRADWATIEDCRQAAKAPAPLWRPDPLARLLSANPGVTRVAVDDAALAASLKRRYGALVVHAPGAFDAAEDAFDEALAPVVALPGGGRLVIEPTAALTAIDVDSGGGRPADANRQAVAEVARQLRLRGIGGQVAVDFIAGGGKGPLFKLATALKKAVAADPVPTHVFGVSGLGLVELTRERHGPALAELMTECQTAPAVAAAAYAGLRRALAEAAHRPGKALALVAAPEIAAALTADAAALAEAEARLGAKLTIRGEPGRARQDIVIEEFRG